MKRWHIESGSEIESTTVDQFLEEVAAVCRKHRLSIAHEDCGGAFIVAEFDESNIDWLMAAHVECVL